MASDSKICSSSQVTQSQQHGSPGISQRRVSGSAGDGYGLHYPLDYPERLKLMIYRRSADAELFRKQRYALPIEETMAELLRQEDLDGDCLITIEDGGPKVCPGNTLVHGFRVDHPDLPSPLPQGLTPQIGLTKLR